MYPQHYQSEALYQYEGPSIVGSRLSVACLWIRDVFNKERNKISHLVVNAKKTGLKNENKRLSS
jgi:hypothetical protein